MPLTTGLASARAPGKIILTGEHFVVLGAPAIAMAIGLYAYASVAPAPRRRVEVGAGIPLHALGSIGQAQNLKAEQILESLRLAARETLDYIGESQSGVSVDVDCEIPVGAGLGSSASTTVAAITAVARAKQARLTRQDVFKIAFGPESYLHGNPSGVDHATSIYGGIIHFVRPGQVKKFSLKHVPRILVCDTGIHRSTKKLVGEVVRKSRNKKRPFSGQVDEATEISESAARALRRGDAKDLGRLMNANHELLVQIGVSHPKLDKLVHVARASGALGAKLTGAGGGGCVIVLCESSHDETSISRALKRNGGIPYRVNMDLEGARTIQPTTVLK